MVESIESPHGDQVDRTAAAAATSKARTDKVVVTWLPGVE